MAPLLGRDALLADLTDQLRSASLVTLVGPGGIGKTSLAHALVDGPDAVFLDLSGARGREALVREVARQLHADVPPDPRRALEVLARVLGAIDGPVVFDNLEQVREPAGAVLGHLVRAGVAPIIATSRVALGIHQEQVVPVPPLSPRIALEVFLQHADRGLIDPERDAHALSALIGQLGGNPLALRLAAGRTPLQGLDRIREALQVGAPLEDWTGELPPRHASLAAVVAWSWDLLAEPEREAMRTLATFEGSLRVEDAIACGVQGPAVLGLLRASLLHREVAGEGVQLRLPVPVRQWVRTHEPPGEDACLAHDRWVARRSTELVARTTRVDFADARRALAALVPDARAALSRVEASRGPTSVALLGPLLDALTDHHSRVDVAYVAELYDRLGTRLVEIESVQRAHIVRRFAGALRRRGRATEALSLLRDEIARARPDEQTAAEVILSVRLGNELMYTGHRVDGWRMLEELLPRAEAIGDPVILAETLRYLGTARRVTRSERPPDGEDGFVSSRETLYRCQQLCEDHGLATVGVSASCHLLLTARDVAEAEALASRARSWLTGSEEQARREHVLIHSCLMAVLLDLGEISMLRETWPEYERSLRDLGDLEQLTHQAARLAVAEAALAPHDGSATALREALVGVRSAGVGRYEAWLLVALGACAHREGRLDEALEYYASGRDRDRELQLTEADRFAADATLLIQLERQEPIVHEPEHAVARSIAAHLRGDASRQALRCTLDTAVAKGFQVVADAWWASLGRAILERVPTWLIAEDGTWALDPSGAHIDLTRRRAASRILAHLAHAHAQAPGQSVGAESLIGVGWPGERILPSAARARLYAAARDLRKHGLQDLLQTVDGGYRLDPASELEIREARSDPRWPDAP